MKKTERMNGIVLLLKERGRMTAPELANYFEVSERTIYRDIDALSQLKVPLIAYEGLGGGYEVDADYFMPSIQLTQEEVRVLLMVLKMGDAAKMPNLEGTYAVLKSKILNSLEQDKCVRLDNLLERVRYFMSRIEPAQYQEGVFRCLLDGLEQNYRVRINYYTPKRNTYSERIVSLESLFFEDGGWYARGFCHLRGESRTFRIDRIHETTLTEIATDLPEKLISTDDKFSLRTYLLEMTPSLYRVIKENEYMINHELLAHDQLYRIRITTSLNDEIKSLVLMHVENVTLLEPKEIIREIKEKAQQLYKIYNNPDI